MKKNYKNVLLSYPRSGNHLCRFFIELLSGIPTYGCKGNKYDIAIYKNKFDEPIPFDILENYDRDEAYFKYHSVPPNHINTKKIILIVRNPREVLLRNCYNKFNINGGLFSYDYYFKNIDFYNNHTGKKIMLYYEDMITNRKKFINELYDFLDINNLEKKKYVLSNVDKLYNLSSKGRNRSWGGFNSNYQIDHYYKNIPESIKTDFDNYLNKKIEKYQFLKKKYNNDKYLIISFCNYDYVKLAEIWVEALHKLSITNYIIISADKETYSYLLSKNINTELKIHNLSETFWVYRIKVLQTFLERDTIDYLIHSDLDAIWKKNICEEILKNNFDMDLYFSQGTVFPNEHLLKHEFVLCCGFFCIKCNDKTKNFIDKYIGNLIKIKDDQKAINIELVDTEWNTESKHNSLPGKKYIYFEDDIRGYNSKYNLNILLISFLKIQREIIDENGYVYHILTPKNCEKKNKYF